MNESDPTPQVSGPRLPRGLAGAVVILLSLQLGLGYLQGALLHRQHAELQSMRADLQDLVEALEQSQGNVGGAVGEGGSWSFTRGRSRNRAVPGYSKTHLAVLGSEEEEKAVKELQESKDSAKKAVQEARKAQEQVSFTENARKADEQAKLQAAQSGWQKWTFLGLGLVLAALVLRAWLRRRG